MIKLTQKY